MARGWIRRPLTAGIRTGRRNGRKGGECSGWGGSWCVSVEATMALSVLPSYPYYLSLEW